MAFYAGGHVCQCLSHLLTLRRDYTVMVSGDRRLSGQQFVTEVLGLAHGLRQLGLGSGDVVAIAALNRDLYLEWLLAVTFVGGIVAPLNYRWSFGEARSAMEVVRPVMLVTDGSCGSWFAGLRDNAMSSIRWHVSMCLESNKLSGAKIVLTTGEIMKPSSSTSSLSFNYLWAPQCIALICFTSGTTGRPKGVKISHSALIVQSLAKIAIVGYGDDDVYLHTAPLCHVGGISSAMAMLMAGGCHIIIPKFEAKIACDSIEQHRVTSLITVPAMMVDLISVIREKKTWSGKHSVKKILNGGGSLSSQIIHEATHFFPKSKLITAYGMTEACSSLTFMTLWNPSREPCDQSPQMSKTNSSSIHQSEGVCVGKPAPHVELKIDVEEPSPIGRIMTRGPHMMLGYWDQNSAHISVPCKMGWLDTGDIGKIDHNGNVWLIGRANGRIKSGGENVYPEEVEAVISQHPGVSGIVVVGALDARLTEMVVACVSLKDDWHWTDHCSVISKHHPCLLSSDILRQYCKEKKLSGQFKIPKIFVAWRKPFPFTMSGKLRRDQVKTEVASILRSLPSNL